MKNFLFLLCALFMLNSCGTVPLTGRQQIMLVSNEEILSSSLKQYDSYITKSQKSTNAQAIRRVVTVGKRVAAATEAYLKANGLASEVSNFSWEFNLVKDDQVNAFCMPGGKIVVYEGLLKVAQTDAELALVLGHEIAHAVAKHSNERMSQQMLEQYGMQIINQATQQKSEAINVLANSVYGLGTKYGIMLPFSRTQEYEADRLGLMFMAMAGYDPQIAAGFWRKMSAQGGASAPEFMNTHPSDANRIAQIEKYLPEAMKRYKK
ncbi:MAG: M48 family metallopeptidase [Massilibacteroides sp.]|nr:M48 family metallopeptidase [Massilibacteroides sp.]